jgi:hypothetical protein
MSRAKKARADERRLAASAPPAGLAKPKPKPRPVSAQEDAPPEQAAGESRIEAARRRSAAAKVGVAGVAILAFGAALGFSRLTYAGHTKKPLRPLAAPPKYVQIVRENLLEAGIVAPAQAPPGAATASS